MPFKEAWKKIIKDNSNMQKTSDKYWFKWLTRFQHKYRDKHGTRKISSKDHIMEIDKVMGIPQCAALLKYVSYKTPKGLLTQLP